MINKFLLCCTVLLVMASSCTDADDLSPKQSPNIVWIMAEDLSPDLACYGYPGVLTPNLDEFAENGVRFTQVFVTAPACAPSRSALATGMYQDAINAQHMRYPDNLKNALPRMVLPINELFRQKGYQTVNLGEKPGTGKTDWSFKSDLAAYDHQFWDSLEVGKPFFAVINLRNTHRPFERDTLHPIDPAGVTVPPYYPDHPVAREDFARYLESVQVLDTQVGEVLQTLYEKGYADNTIVLFFSDHGRPMSRDKNYLYDSGLHIPLMIKCPDSSPWREYLPKAVVNEQLISAIDISATSLAIAGITRPAWMQGKVILGPNKDPERTAIFAASDRIGEAYYKSRAMRTQNWKYIRNYRHDYSVNSAATAYRRAFHPIYHLLNVYEEKGLLTPEQEALVKPLPEEELFELQSDPYEVRNLAADPTYTEQLEQLRGQLATWQTSIGDRGMEEDSKALQQAFETYGRESQALYQEKIDQLEAEVRRRVEALAD